MGTRARGAITVAVLIVGAAAGPVQAAEEACFGDWSEAAAAVKKHGLVPVDRLGVLARKNAQSRLVKTRLCRTPKGYVYNVVVRGPRGRLKRFKLDAKNPFAHGATMR